MKTEDIDKKIGMPNVDEEWAKFEREVIGENSGTQEHKSSKTFILWGLSIAASIALIVGFFFLGHDDKELQEKVAAVTQQPAAQVVQEDDTIISEVEQLPDADLLAMETPKNTEKAVTKTEASGNPTTKEDVEEEKVFSVVEESPRFPGGDKALMEYLKTNLRYPDLAMEYGARGRVMMTFLVDSTGHVSDIKAFRYMRMSYDTLRLSRETEEMQELIKEQIVQLLGEESTRILSLMPTWEPGKMVGKPVNVRYTVPIRFQATEAERQTYLAQKQTADDELQGRIAGLTIVPTSTDLGSGNTMRLAGTRVAGRDSVRIGQKPDDDFLVVVDGQPLSEAEQKQMLSSGIHIYFFNRQQIINSIYIYKDEDAKRPYVEKYGERAKNAVMLFTTAPDTLCDAYVQQHPELMQTLHRVEGYVIDNDTEKPLPDTWINYTWTTNYKNVGDTWIKHTDGAGAATDSTGHFILWLPHKDAKLQASRTGYVTVRINQLADTTFTIRMTNATIIKDVEVVPKSSIRIRGNE